MSEAAHVRSNTCEREVARGVDKRRDERDTKAAVEEFKG